MDSARSDACFASAFRPSLPSTTASFLRTVISSGCCGPSVSSTIRWAIACGKPVINYDVYRYQYTDYLDVKAVVATEEKDEFLELLRRMTGEAGFYRGMVGHQVACAKKWGQLDGQVGARLLKLFDGLITKYQRGDGENTEKPEIGRSQRITVS